jgi:uroporphyrinogen III methyltransferase/synthase
MPTIEVSPVEDLDPLRRAVADLQQFDFLLLTSANAVRPLREVLAEAGRDGRALAGVKICAVGPGTASALRELGLVADLLPRDHRAEGILELFPPEAARGRRFLFPRAREARELLPRELAARGAHVELIPVYETRLPPPDAVRRGVEELEGGGIDILTFTSASTAKNFAAIVGGRLRELCAGKVTAAIGPVTREACLATGLSVDVMPDTYTIPALVDALVDFFHRRR